MQAHLQDMYDRAYAFIGLLDIDGRVVDANRRALDFAGITLDEVRGKPFWETVWWEACAASREQLKDAIARGRLGKFTRFEAVHVNRRGERVDVDFTLTPVFDADGKVVQLQPEGRDITDAKRASEALRRSEERLRLATEAAGIGTFVVDVERRLAHYSPELAAMLGFPEVTEIPIEAAFQRVHRDDVARVRAEYAAAIGPGGDGRMRTEMRFVRPGGEVRWMWFNGRVEYRGTGAGRVAVEIIGACADITDRKQAEERLRESEERFRSLVALSSDWYWEQDESLRFVDISEGVLTLAGSTAPSHLGKTRWELPSIGVSEEEWAAHRELLERHEPFRNLEYRRRTERGDIIWMSVSGVPIFDARGRFKGYRGTGHNITARREADERRKFLLELSDALRPLADSGRIQATACALLGEHLGVSRVCRCDVEGGELVVRQEYVQGVGPVAGRGGLASFGDAIARSAFRGENIAVADVRSDPRLTAAERARFRAIETAAFVICSLVEDGRRTGAFAIHSASPRAWRETEIELVRDVAERAWAAAERARAETALRASEERLRLALDAGAMGTWDWDLATNEARWDARQRMLFGLAPGSEPVTHERFVAAVHRDDRKGLQQATERILGVAGAFRHEFRVVLPDGGIRWLSGFGQSIFGDGAAPVRMVGVNFDITERKLAEERLLASEARFRATFEVSSVGMCQAEPWTGRLVHVNRSLCTMLDYDEAELVGRSLADFAHPDERAAIVAGAAGVARKEMREYRGRTRFLRKDGSEFWGDVTLNLVLGADGQPAQAIALVQDITEQVRARELLSRANEELEARVAVRTRQLRQEMALREEAQAALAQAQRMEALGQLTGGIAHDFNNLLTVVSGNLELAEARITDEGARRSVRQAIEAVDMGASLNRRLLTFARRRQLAPRRLVLNERVAEMQRLLRRTIGEQVTLATELDQGLWPAQVDPGEIDSAIINIAINARDAMPSGGTLTLATRNVALDAARAREVDVRPGHYVCLSLRDSGHGMAPDVLRRAIEPFFTTKEPGKGTGLGLSSVYGFARQSGGFLEIVSEPGVGTTVAIFIPRAGPETAASVTRRAGSDVPTGDGQLILVVEDNDQVRQVTLARLESLGYDVIEASSGPEAVAMLAADAQVALVFSDVVMPGGMSGYDVARLARARRPNVKVLLTSGNDEPPGHEPGEAEGLRVLAKPYTRAQLGQAIHEVLVADGGGRAARSGRR